MYDISFDGCRFGLLAYLDIYLIITISVNSEFINHEGHFTEEGVASEDVSS